MIRDCLEHTCGQVVILTFLALVGVAMLVFKVEKGDYVLEASLSALFLRMNSKGPTNVSSDAPAGSDGTSKSPAA